MHAQHQHQQVDACMSHEHGHRDRWWQVVNDICLHSSYHVAYCILSLITLNSTRNPVVVWNPYSTPGLVPAILLHHSTASAFHAQCPFASQSETAPQRFQQYAKSHRTGDLLLQRFQPYDIASHEHHLQSRNHIFRAVQQDAVQQPQGPVGHSCCPAGSCQCAGHSRPNSPTAAYSTARCTQ